MRSDLVALLVERDRRTQFPRPEYLAFSRANRPLDWISIEARAGALVALPVVFSRDGRFDFCADDAEGAEIAIVGEALDVAEDPIDLFAWSTEDPRRFATALGRAVFLGAGSVVSPATYCLGAPLILHQTPLAWVRSGCRGAVILDRKRAARALLDVTGRIGCENTAHAHELHALLSSVYDPSRLMVRQELRAAA